MQSESDYVYNIIRSDTDDSLTINSGVRKVLVISAFFFQKTSISSLYINQQPPW